MPETTGIKVSQMDSATSLADSDLLMVVQGDTNKKVTLDKFTIKGQTDISSAPVTVDNTNTTLAQELSKLEAKDNTQQEAIDAAATKTSLSKVATSGEYGDLTGAPKLATVATSGSYNDLTDKPSDANTTYTLEQNSLNGRILTFKGSDGTSTEITIPGSDSSGGTVDPSQFAKVATTGKYEDLIGKPELATVATSGSYNDLTDKPTIPVDTNTTYTLTQDAEKQNVLTFADSEGNSETITLKGMGGAELNQVKVSIPTSGWVGTQSPYTYDLGADYANKAVMVGFDSTGASSTEYQVAVASEIQGGDGTTLYAWGSKPTVSIPIVIFTFE